MNTHFFIVVKGHGITHPPMSALLDVGDGHTVELFRNAANMAINRVVRLAIEPDPLWIIYGPDELDVTPDDTDFGDGQYSVMVRWPLANGRRTYNYPRGHVDVHFFNHATFLPIRRNPEPLRRIDNG